MEQVTLTERMARENIAAIHSFPSFDRVSVTLRNGGVGVGSTIAEALDKAKADDLSFYQRFMA